MAVAPASMADKIIVLDDDDDNNDVEQRPQSSSSEHRAKNVSLSKNQHLVQTHNTQSPFSSAKKNTKALQVENQKLFDEFVQHCTPLTNECPEVLTFLQTKHSKACPDYLCSVEFRNALGQCLTQAQGNVTKTFVYINELCTVLKQHAVKKRQTLSKVEPSAAESGSHQSTSTSLKSKDKTKGRTAEQEDGVKSEEEAQPSGELRETKEENPEADRKARRALRKQIAYLENLLKLYNDEIYRLQQAELSLDDMEAEDSTYIQEHKLKRKMMKIYEKLCELKGCSSLTGRVIEQRIRYTGTRYPEINKRIERFINSPGTQNSPPNYSDILHQVERANKRHGLCLNAEQREEVAREAFTETGKRVQERRHLDLVYNFGSRLTDTYKPATDPALMDPSLLKKLRSNRIMALSRLEEVINKYAVKQDMVDKEKLRMDKENQKVGEKSKTRQTNGAAQDEEDEEDDGDEDEDESSDPDIEEEIEASTQQPGADDDDDNEEDNNNEADEDGDDADNKEDQTLDETGSTKDEDDPTSDETQISPMSDIPSPRDSPSQSESMQTDNQPPLSNESPAASQQQEDSSNQVPGLPETEDPTDLPSSPAAAVTNGNPSPEQKTVTVQQSDTQTTNGTSPVPSPKTTRSKKRKREEMMSSNSRSTKQKMSSDSDADIPLDMGVICCGSPQKEESSALDTPTKNPTVSVQSTPPPKKNKVNVATQCDPDEIIVLSDSD